MSAGARATVHLVAEYPPPAAGMPVQAATLAAGLGAHLPLSALATNDPLPRPFTFLDRVRGVRGALRTTRLLWRLRQVREGDVVHVFANSGLGFFLFVAPSVARARRVGATAIVHYHGGLAGAFLKRWGAFARPVLAAAERLVVPSGFLVEVFAAHGLEAQVIGNPVLLERFEIAGRTREFRPIVLSCRNLEPVYDVATTLRTFARVHTRIPGARLRVVGDGSERRALERLAASLGVAAAVEFLGNVPNCRIPELMADATVLLNTSTADNLPVSLIEAMAASLPIVSTEVGGIVWLIEPEVNGLLAAVGDDRGLSEAVVRILDDAMLRERLALAGRDTARTFDWSQIAGQWLSLYAELSPSRDFASALESSSKRAA